SPSPGDERRAGIGERRRARGAGRLLTVENGLPHRGDGRAPAFALEVGELAGADEPRRVGECRRERRRRRRDPRRGVRRAGPAAPLAWFAGRRPTIGAWHRSRVAAAHQSHRSITTWPRSSSSYTSPDHLPPHSTVAKTPAPIASS